MGMGGCASLLFMLLCFGYAIVVIVLRTVADSLVGTPALPLLVVSSLACFAAIALVVRILWLTFHDHVSLDMRRIIVLPIVLAVVALVTFWAAVFVAGISIVAAFS